MSCAAPVLAFLALVCAASATKFIDGKQLKELRQVVAAERDAAFVEFVWNELDLFQKGNTESSNVLKIKPSAQIAWCTDRELCKYGFTVVWDERGFRVRPMTETDKALQAECMRKQARADALKLDFKCPEDE